MPYAQACGPGKLSAIVDPLGCYLVRCGLDVAPHHAAPIGRGLIVAPIAQLAVGHSSQLGLAGAIGVHAARLPVFFRLSDYGSVRLGRPFVKIARLTKA
jgi:hypothetical protein